MITISIEMWKMIFFSKTQQMKHEVEHSRIARMERNLATTTLFSILYSSTFAIM